MPTMNDLTPETNHFQAPDDNKNINEGAETVGACISLILIIAFIATVIVNAVYVHRLNSRLARLNEARTFLRENWVPAVLAVQDEDGVVHKVYERQFGFYHAEPVESIDGHHLLICWMPGNEPMKFIHARSRCRGCAEIEFKKTHPNAVFPCEVHT